MPLRKCLDLVVAKNFPEEDKDFMLKQSDGYKEQGMSERDADRKALVDYHKKLHDDLNGLKTKLKLPISEHTPIDKGISREEVLPDSKIDNTEIFEHGKDTNTEKGLENGTKPTELTEDGVAEAKGIAKHLSENGKEENEIVSSSVSRAKATASEAAKEYKNITGKELKHSVNPVLDTWNIGKYDGKPEGSFNEQEWVDKPTKKPTGGESFNKFKTRMVKAYQFIKENPDITPITHSKVIRALDALDKTNGEWTDETTQHFLNSKEGGQNAITKSTEQQQESNKQAGVSEYPRVSTPRVETTQPRTDSGDSGKNGEGTKQQEEITQGGEPPKEPPLSETIHAEYPKTILTHKGLQEIATEIGGEDVTPRERESRLAQLKEADNTISEWQQNDTYDKNISDIINRAKEGKIDEVEQKILANHIATLREERRSIVDKNSKEFKDKTDELAKVIDAAKTMRSKAGGLLGDKALGNTIPKDYGSPKDIQDARENKTGKPEKELPDEIKELSSKVKSLEDENAKLQKQLTDNLSKGRKSTEKTFTEKAKNVADRFRQLKQKPFIFKDENGNDINIQQMGFGWNDLIEIGAKAIEKTGEIADGVAAIIDKIKDSDWYEKFSANDKQKFEEQLQSHYENSIEETPEAKNIKRLEKQLDDLRSGKLPQTKDKRTLSEREKDLQDAIFEEKKKLGLISSKETKAKEHQLEITIAEKKIEKLQKEKKDLENGIVKQKSQNNLNATPEQKARIEQLNDEIADLKKNLGVNKSKLEKPLTEQEQIEKDQNEFKDLVSQFANKKDSKFTPEQSQAIWDYAKKTYIKDASTFNVGDMVHKVAMDLGLKPEQILNALAPTKETKDITAKMYRNNYESQKAKRTIQGWVNKESKPVETLFNEVAAPFRAAATAFHGHALLFTHAGANLTDPQLAVKFLSLLGKQWKIVYGDNVNYEKAKSELQNKPLYNEALKAGVGIDPNTVYDDWQLANNWLKKIGVQGNKGFLILKMMRYEVFANEYNKLSAIEKADKATLKEVGQNANHWTGTSGIKVSPTANAVFFAPNLIVSKFARLTTDPIKAIAGLRPNAPLEQRAAAKIILKKTGRFLAMYAGALGTNAALLKLTGSTQSVNFTDPTKNDWLKFKTGDALGDKIVDISSGLVPTMQFLTQLVMLPFESEKEIPEDYYGSKTAKDALSNETVGYFRKTLSPFGSTVWDILSHRDYRGNVLPFYNDKLHGKQEKLSVLQYMAQKSPIPLADAFQTIHDQMREDGVDELKTRQILGGIFIAAIASTGIKLGNEPKDRPTPYTEQDKKDPTFKYYLDRKIELPNTPLQSVVINNDEKGTNYSVSDYSPEIQAKYINKWKQNLKEELKTIKENGVVFVKTYKKKDGTIEKDVSAKPPSGDFKEVSFKNLTNEELEQVLHIAQSSATDKTKQDIFGQQ